MFVDDIAITTTCIDIDKCMSIWMTLAEGKIYVIQWNFKTLVITVNPMVSWREFNSVIIGSGNDFSSAPSHLLRQCCLFVNWTDRNKRQWIWTKKHFFLYKGTFVLFCTILDILEREFSSVDIYIIFKTLFIKQWMSLLKSNEKVEESEHGDRVWLSSIFV